jgi:hypothetical protein
MVSRDMSNQSYVELPGPGQDHIRITCVPAVGYRDEPHFRVSVRENEGRLRQGPEIPYSRLGEFFQGLLELSAECFASTV